MLIKGSGDDGGTIPVENEDSVMTRLSIRGIKILKKLAAITGDGDMSQETREVILDAIGEEAKGIWTRVQRRFAGMFSGSM
jgi:hypothetical protein